MLLQQGGHRHAALVQLGAHGQKLAMHVEHSAVDQPQAAHDALKHRQTATAASKQHRNLGFSKGLLKLLTGRAAHDVQGMRSGLHEHEALHELVDGNA